MISPKICHCIHPFFREYAPVSTPSSYCIRYSVIKRYSVIVLYKMHIVQCCVCVLCWWVSDYLGLIGDNILGAGKNTDLGTPGKHRNTIQHKCKSENTLQHKYSGAMPKEVVAIG